MPYGRGQAELTGERLNAWKMVRRRANRIVRRTTEVSKLTGQIAAVQMSAAACHELP